MQLTFRVKRRLPAIFKAMEAKEDPIAIRHRFSLSPRMYTYLRGMYQETLDKKELTDEPATPET